MAAQLPQEQIDILDKLQDLITSVKSIPEAGSGAEFSPNLRHGIYLLIQSQTQADEEGAIYTDLKCPIHLGLLGRNTAFAGGEREIITLGCGHSFCRGCIRQWIGRPYAPLCPTCRVPIVRGSENVTKSICLTNIMNRLKPIDIAGGKKQNRKTRKNRKYFSLKI